MLTGLVALVIASAFTSAAIYIYFVEHPARMENSARYALTQWRVAHKRGSMMEGGLALAGGLLSLAAWQITGEKMFMLGGVLLLANVLYALLVMGPVSRKLVAFRDTNDMTLPKLLNRWNGLHAIRTLLGAASTGAMFVGVVEGL